MRTLWRWYLDAVADVALNVLSIVVPVVVAVAFGVLVDRFDATPAGAWYPLVLGSIGGYLTYIALNEATKARRSRSRTSPDLRAVYQEVRDLTDAAGATSNVDTALLVLDEARSGYERAFSGLEGVETKASALLSIVAGASSAIGIFGFGKDGRAIVVTHLIGAALICIVTALVLLFYILRAKQRRHCSAPRR
jgi:hypothetical protein